MIFRNGKEIVDIHKGGKAATALYKGSRLVWEAVKSCFGRGMWIEAKPWVNTDGWRNDR
jgi:hypothetical protein